MGKLFEKSASQTLINLASNQKRIENKYTATIKCKSANI